MSHDIYEDRFAGTRPAWHRIGQALEEGATAGDAMAAARLDGWNIRTVPLDMPSVRNNGLHVIVRSLGDDQCEVVSDQLVESGYLPLQNEELFGPIVEVITGTGLKVDAAGALGRFGNRAFMTFRAPDIEAHGNEQYERYVVAIAPHTGRDAAIILRTAIRVVCRNTEQAAINSSKRIVRIHHSAAALEAFHDDVESARKVLDLSAVYDSELHEMVELAQSVRVDASDFYLAAGVWKGRKQAGEKTQRELDNIDRAYESLCEAWRLEQLRADALGQDESLWTVKQAISTYAQHLARGGDNQRARRSMRIAEGVPVPMMDEIAGVFAQCFREYRPDMYDRAVPALRTFARMR